MIRAILIDPEARTIKEVQTRGRLADIHELVRDQDGLDHFLLAQHPTSWEVIWVKEIDGTRAVVTYERVA